ncbi:hypothetical protein HOG16_03350 [Candidatus Woesearchaeota archaeon]|nr:hypothetical protein [Candidatus Woesearchaeota archaeon]MBT4321561.1 hypothetical protein [Candidatus Woesearchaeota archaeon]
MIKTCEKLPFNNTFFEEAGFCLKPSDLCKYCRFDSRDYSCTKKTYTPLIEFK